MAYKSRVTDEAMALIEELRVLMAAARIPATRRPATPEGRWSRLLLRPSGVLICLSAVCIALLLADGIRGALDPFFVADGKWQGVQFMGAVQVLEHEPLYPDYAEHGSYNPYSPLVPVLHAFAMWLFGASLIVPKLLAFLACLLALTAVFMNVHLLTKSRAAGLIGVGIFAALSHFSWYWYFNIRPDIFATAFTIWGVYVAARHLDDWEGLVPPVVASLLFTLAALCKQNFAIWPAAYLGFLAFSFGVKTMAAAGLPFLLMGGGAFLWYNSGEEHLLATTMAIAGHPMSPFGLIARELHNLLLDIAVPVCLAAAAILSPRREARRGHPAFWPGVFALSFLTGLVPFLKAGGSLNSFVLFCAATSVLACTGAIARLVNRSGWNMRASMLAFVATILFLTLSVGRFVYRLAASKYSIEDVRQEDRFVREHRDKRIYYPSRNYVTYLASGQYHASGPMIWDRSMAGLSAPRLVTDALRSRHFDYILGEFSTTELQELRDRYYSPSEALQLGKVKVYVPISRRRTTPANGSQ